MPVDWIDAEPAGHWLLCGRVLERPFRDTILVEEGSHRIQVDGDATRGVEPGELVRIRAIVEAHPAQVVAPVDRTFPVYRAFEAETVHRPRRSPFARGSETFRQTQEGLRGRLSLRHAMRERFRGYFRAQRFVEVETPSVVPCPGLDVHLDAFDVRGADGVHAGWLATSPELHLKRLLAGGMPRVVEFARCHRNGERGRRHEPEFTMVEWYRAWAGLDDILADTEALVRAATHAGATPDAILVDGRELRLDGDFERLTVREAFARWAPHAGDPIALAAANEAEYFRRLSVDIEPHLGVERPVFLTHFPAMHASLARLADDDASVCLRAELYVAGVELCNAFDELTDPDEQRARFAHDQALRAARGLPVYPVDDAFLQALDEGLPPSAGNALGFDRLVALLAGTAAIGDAVAFSRAR